MKARPRSHFLRSVVPDLAPALHAQYLLAEDTAPPLRRHSPRAASVRAAPKKRVSYKIFKLETLTLQHSSTRITRILIVHRIKRILSILIHAKNSLQVDLSRF